MNNPEAAPPASPAPCRRKWLRWLLALILLPVAIYIVEDIHGAVRWGWMKRKLAAQGHKTDYHETIPPEIPDTQNIFKAPIAKLWLPRKGDGIPKEARLPEFPHDYPPSFDTPYKLEDIKSLPQSPAANDPDEPSRTGLDKWFNQWGPQFDELYEATRRPQARLDGDYSVGFQAPVPNYVRFRSLAQILGTRAKLDFVLGHHEQGVRDLATITGLMKALDTEPHLLVSAMIRVAIGGLYVDALREVMNDGLLNESDLIAIQEQLTGVDLVTAAWKAVHESERLATCNLIDQLVGEWDSKKAADLFGNQKRMGQFVAWAPRGWLRLNQVTVSELLMTTFDGFDPKTRRVNPAAIEAGTRKFDSMTRHATPYNLMSMFAIPNFVKAQKVAAFNQTLVDQALVVCALERFKLANKVPPESLNDLPAKFLKSRPHDLFTGKDFVYRSKMDDTYILYSVGWNGTDDGGFGGGAAVRVDSMDWVW